MRGRTVHFQFAASDNPLTKRIGELAIRAGGVAPLACELRVSKRYLMALADGVKVNPSDEFLKKLGLRRTYVRIDEVAT